jgi:hypothetical protein
MKTVRAITVLMIAAIMAACAPGKEMQPHDWALDVQNAGTREAHILLAEHYEEVARNMQTEAEEEKRMLTQYQANPHKYGKRILDLKAQAQAMILDLEKAARESRQMAEYHRRFAEESQ